MMESTVSTGWFINNGAKIRLIRLQKKSDKIMKTDFCNYKFFLMYKTKMSTHTTTAQNKPCYLPCKYISNIPTLPTHTVTFPERRILWSGIFILKSSRISDLLCVGAPSTWKTIFGISNRSIHKWQITMVSNFTYIYSK